MPPELTDILDRISVWEAFAVILGIGVLAAAGVKGWKVIKRLNHFLDDVMGEEERPGVPARPGLMERVMRVEHELFPNSGSSMRDQTNRIENTVKVLSDDMTEVRSAVDDLNGNVTSLRTDVDEHIEEAEPILNQIKEQQP